MLTLLTTPSQSDGRSSGVGVGVLGELPRICGGSPNGGRLGDTQTLLGPELDVAIGRYPTCHDGYVFALSLGL